ncbi:DUF401 family protein [Oceanirhabdus sp. W0125-5]|uniref:DUF401 family protein n=1 Tax=Oceanirhabdus sp. W0125-5 TaxID=2999116 RepID=UPI0022F2A815|nr:DUF401 family protein [Oceanirhabdus sp. W0125-5]WBW95892.1 DUF401 family protein [Oceanirhabdus sp. W0125-5]
MAFLKLGISLALILLLVNKKVNRGLALGLGAIVLSILFGKGIFHAPSRLLYTFTEPRSINITLSVTLICVLGYYMGEFGILNKMIEYLELMLQSSKKSIMFAPAFVGTLLVSGGALMSCPIVETLGCKLNLQKDKQAAVNMVFRHALYFIFPLSSTLILAIELGNFEMGHFVLMQLPMALSMWIIGYVAYLRNVKETSIESNTNEKWIKSFGMLLLYSSPISISLVSYTLGDYPLFINIAFGIIVSIVLVLILPDIKQNFSKEKLLGGFTKGIKLSIVLSIIGIMFFKNVVNDIPEIYDSIEGIIRIGIPLEIILFICCAVISYPLASVQPAVAILFPMIIPLAPDYITALRYGMFIYTSAFMFYYISPLHMCQVLTLEYFNLKIKDLYNNYKLLLPATYAVMVIVYILIGYLL